MATVRNVVKYRQLPSNPQKYSQIVLLSPFWSQAMAKKLLEQLRDALRLKHYSYRTEEAYLDWVKRFILFHNKKHPKDMVPPRFNLSSLISPCNARFQPPPKSRHRPAHPRRLAADRVSVPPYCFCIAKCRAFFLGCLDRSIVLGRAFAGINPLNFPRVYIV